MGSRVARAIRSASGHSEPLIHQQPARPEMAGSQADKERPMINEESLTAIDSAQFTADFIRPRYDAYGFAQIPQTIRCCLTDSKQKGVSFGPRDDLYQQYDTVILFLIDAFGWRFFEQYHDRSPFLKRAVKEGAI